MLGLCEEELLIDHFPAAQINTVYINNNNYTHIPVDLNQY